MQCISYMQAKEILDMSQKKVDNYRELSMDVPQKSSQKRKN